MNEAEIKITIFGEKHDPSKEIEIYAPKDDQDREDISLKDYTQIIDTPYGLSALYIYKATEFWDNQQENNYDIMHNCREIHYLHDKGNCAFEGWGMGRNLMFTGKTYAYTASGNVCGRKEWNNLKEMYIIKSPKWFDHYENQVVYQYPSHPPLDEAVHPTWTGPLPDYAAKTITA